MFLRNHVRYHNGAKGVHWIVMAKLSGGNIIKTLDKRLHLHYTLGTLHNDK